MGTAVKLCPEQPDTCQFSWTWSVFIGDILDAGLYGGPPWVMQVTYTVASPSQWPRGLRHELSSLARTLGSWVRIQLKAWMSVLVYSVFVMFCMKIAAPCKESYRL
jgi:hypothetical protein